MLFLVLLVACCHCRTPAASCDHVVYNSNVVWFPLCCKGQKSPALPRPDAAAGECHKSWRSLTKHECANEERGLLLSYVGLHFSHERKPITYLSLISDMGLRLSPSVYSNLVLCVYVLTQIKPVPEWRIGFCCLAYRWLDLSSPDPFIRCVCVCLCVCARMHG